MWRELLTGLWTPQKAWFLGVLYGDGNVYKDSPNGSYRVSASGSESTTTRWLALIHPTRKPRKIPGANAWEAYIYDKTLVEWIEGNLGICGPKADSMAWPDIPAEFERDFVRGLWDSDGTLTIERRRHKQGRGNDAPIAGYTSASLSFVESLKLTLARTISTPPVVTIRSETLSEITGKLSVCYTFHYAGASALLVSDWLYAKGAYDPKLVNDDRVAVYAEQCALRDFLKNQRCKCGALPYWEGLCQPCWWDQHGRSTGKGTCCSIESCGKSVLAHGLCSGHYSKQRRSKPGYVKPSQGLCIQCSKKDAYRKNLCDACYSANRRKYRKTSEQG